LEIQVGGFGGGGNEKRYDVRTFDVSCRRAGFRIGLRFRGRRRRGTAFCAPDLNKEGLMRYYILAILLLSFVAVPGTAQSPQNSWEGLKQYKPGHKIKVVDVKFKAWSGKLVSVSDEAITIQNGRKKQEIAVERPNVLRVTDLQRSKRGRNALIGFAAGAIIGIGAVAGRGRGEAGEHEQLLAVGLFGFPGVGIGALFPGPRPTLYRAPKPPPAVPASKSTGLNMGQ
jgi:hypothetical protein